MFTMLLILIAFITTAASRNVVLHDNPLVTFYDYKRSQQVLSWVHQNKYLTMPDVISSIGEGEDMTYVHVPPAIDAYVWQYTGFFEASWTGDHTFTIDNTKLATIQLGSKSTQSQEFDDLITDEKHYFSKSPATFDLVKGTCYAMKIVFISGRNPASIYLIKDGIKQEIKNETRQPLYSNALSENTKVPRQSVLYFSSGLDYFVFLLPPGLKEKIVLEHYRALIEVDAGTFDEEFKEINLDYVHANRSTEIFGNIRAPQDGDYIISLSQDLMASLQIGPVGFQQNEKFYSVTEDWKIVDTRYRPSEKFHFKRGLFYPFRLAVIGDIDEFEWDISAFDSEEQEVDLFGLWGTPRDLPLALPQPATKSTNEEYPMIKLLLKNNWSPVSRSSDLGLLLNSETKEVLSTSILLTTTQRSLGRFEAIVTPSSGRYNSQIVGFTNSETSYVESLATSISTETGNLYKSHHPEFSTSKKANLQDQPFNSSGSDGSSDSEYYDFPDPALVWAKLKTNKGSTTEISSGDRFSPKPDNSLVKLEDPSSTSNHSYSRLRNDSLPTSGGTHFLANDTFNMSEEERKRLDELIAELSADNFRSILDFEGNDEVNKRYGVNEVKKNEGFQNPSSDKVHSSQRQTNWLDFKEYFFNFGSRESNYPQKHEENSTKDEQRFMRLPEALEDHEKAGNLNRQANSFMEEEEEHFQRLAVNEYFPFENELIEEGLLPTVTQEFPVTGFGHKKFSDSGDSLRRNKDPKKRNAENLMETSLSESGGSNTRESVISKNGCRAKAIIEIPFVLGTILGLLF